MLEWWIDLPKWLKYGVALAFLLVAALAWMAGVFWPWAIGIGIVLLIAAMAVD